MTNEELLKPRYEVIADYPGSTWNIGEIVELGLKPFEKYPAIFKPLFWWEKRKVEDMPNYIHYTHNGRIYILKVKYWGFNELMQISFADVYTGFISYLKDTLPATEQEYLKYINRKK